MEPLLNNVKDTALIFEGGGMLNSYSAGVVNVLLEQGIHFDAVYGLSSGAINAIDYLSRDPRRSILSFTHYAEDMPFRKPLSVAMRIGLLGPTNIEQSFLRDHEMPFDFATFSSNPAQLTIQAVNRDTGETVYWTREDFETEDALSDRVRASLSFPIFMAPTLVEGNPPGFFYDGAPGEGGGIMVPRARRDGFERFFVVSVNKQGFWRNEKPNPLYSIFFWHRPLMRALYRTWARRYNEQRAELIELEKTGAAYTFYANDQIAMNADSDRSLLRLNLERGYRQALGEVDAWKAFLGL